MGMFVFVWGFEGVLAQVEISCLYVGCGAIGGRGMHEPGIRSWDYDRRVTKAAIKVILLSI